LIFAQLLKEDTMPVFELFFKLIVPTNNQVLGIHRFVVIQSSRNLSETSQELILIYDG
jgi:hypothetical protein